MSDFLVFEQKNFVAVMAQSRATDSATSEMFSWEAQGATCSGNELSYKLCIYGELSLLDCPITCRICTDYCWNQYDSWFPIKLITLSDNTVSDKKFVIQIFVSKPKFVQLGLGLTWIWPSLGVEDIPKKLALD